MIDARQVWVEASRVITILAVVGAAGVWAADTRYVQNDQLLQMRLDQLESQMTLLRIKADQGEATRSELIFLETIKDQVQRIKRQLGE